MKKTLPKKMLLFLLLTAFCSNDLLANNLPLTISDIVVTGRVTDANTGQPIPGASIKVKGSQIGTSADTNGLFSLQVPDRATLIISHIGFDAQEIPLNGKKNLSIRMTSFAMSMNDVIVIGYGVQKKTSTTAAVSTMTPAEITQKPVTNLTNDLIGRVSGVIAVQSSGEPGFDGSTIQIRGAGTIGNTGALLIVDGVPRDFSRLDPNTIATISILKDAAAVAPYGVAGANGVILITTKRGTSGKPTLTYNGYAGIQNPTKVPTFVGSYDYALLRNEANANDGNAPAYSAYDLQKFKDHSDPDGHPDGHPLQDIIIPNRLISYQNLTLSGGSEDYKYFASLGYNRQNAMWTTSHLQKFNGNLNITANATKTTTVNFNVTSYEEDQYFPSVGSGSIIDQAQRQAPTTPIYYSNGLWTGYIGQSLIGEIYHSGYQLNQNTALLSQLSIDQKLPVKGLSVKAVASYDSGPDPIFSGNQTSVSRVWHTPIPFYNVDTNTQPYTYVKGIQGNALSSFNESYSQNHSFTYQGMVNYAASFGKSDITALAVVEDRIVKYETFSAGRINYNLDIDELNYGGPAASDATNSGYSTGEKQLGYVYRAGYAYDKKYLFEAAGRYDGSYLFAPGNRFGFFPAFSAGWRMSEEKFISDNYPWIDNLKLRGSWGESGAYPSSGGNIQTYQYLSPYTAYGNSGVLGGTSTQGIYESLQGNPSITWEKSKKTDVGLEGTILKGIFGFEADYFYEKRSNMLVSLGNSLPAEYGVGTGLVNGGIMQNHGVDVTLTSQKTFRNGLRLDIKGTFTYAQNKLLKVYENSATYNNPNRRLTGRPLGEQFGLKALGYYKTTDFDANGVLLTSLPQPTYGTVHPGDIEYADLSGPGNKPDGKIDANDNTHIGPPSTPEIIYGLEPRVSYKNWDIDVLFQGSGLSSQQVNNYFVWPFQSSGSATQLVFDDHWTPTHTNALYPRITGTPTGNNIQQSSWWIRRTAYLRMKSFELGYTFSQRTLAHSIHSLRAFVSGQNLFLWNPYIKEKMDPENSPNNENYYQQRVISFGLNASF
jgi:TonB-linked SusC/RagA family outer membrane protein